MDPGSKAGWRVTYRGDLYPELTGLTGEIMRTGAEHRLLYVLFCLPGGRSRVVAVPSTDLELHP